jgi:hypothetical protein
MESVVVEDIRGITEFPPAGQRSRCPQLGSATPDSGTETNLGLGPDRSGEKSICQEKQWDARGMSASAATGESVGSVYRSPACGV